MAVKLFECEYTPGEELVLRLRKPGLDILSPAVRGHLLEARKEMLTAFRSLIDAALTGLDEKEKAAPRRTKIKVE